LDMVKIQSHSFACKYQVFPAPFIEKNVLFLFCLLDSLVKT
jgi:hypothetical protein